MGTQLRSGSVKRLVLLSLLMAVAVSACSGVSSGEHDAVVEQLGRSEGAAATLQHAIDDQAEELDRLTTQVAALEEELAEAKNNSETLEANLASVREVEQELRELLGSSGECGAYRGVVCEGWVTDAAGVLANKEAAAEAVGEIVGRTGHQIAVVLVPTTGGIGAEAFANELGNTWGVGDATRDDGVVVLVDLGTSVTWVASATGLDLGSQYDQIAQAGDAYFAAGAWDEGIAAILEALEVALATPG